MKPKVKNYLEIRDLSDHCDLDRETLPSIKGGRIKLDPDAEEKRDPVSGEGAGGYLHSHDNFWWLGAGRD
jgi:hypothetical protein